MLFLGGVMKKQWKQLKLWVKSHKYSYSMLYLIFYLVVFFVLEKITVPKYYIYSPIDDWIPFYAPAFLVYASWFIAFPGSLILFLFYCKEDYQKLSFMIFNGSTITFLIYLLFPTYIDLRVPIETKVFFDQLIQWLWSVDSPCNVCPSLHVSVSVSILIVVFLSSKLKKEHPKLRWFVMVWMVLICGSTLLIKQHSVIDVVCGILLSAFLGVAVYKFPVKKMFQKTVFRKLL